MFLYVRLDIRLLPLSLTRLLCSHKEEQGGHMILLQYDWLDHLMLMNPVSCDQTVSLPVVVQFSGEMQKMQLSNGVEPP